VTVQVRVSDCAGTRELMCRCTRRVIVQVRVSDCAGAHAE